MTAASGLLVIDKPAGLTSQQVVGRVRRLMGTKKVGHAGTLDPMATGVLIVGVNRATRLLGHLALHDKRYLATIRLGQSTTTDDAEGETVQTRDASGLTAEAIEAAIVPLRGEIEQVPSSVSAIKVNGRRAYAMVRAGQDVQLKPRGVLISRFDVRETRHDGGFIDVDVEVECSSGTYIRALARDLGLTLGVGGHLTALRRTRIGGYDLGMAVELPPAPEDRLPGDHPGLLTMFSMAEAARRSFPTVVVDEKLAHEISFGRTLDLELLSGPTGLIGPCDKLLALYEPAGEPGRARPVAVLI